MITDESLNKKSKTLTDQYCPPAVDNITDVLIMVIEFAQARQKVLANNIRLADAPDFVPSDLPCKQFAAVLNIALDEHIENSRLLLADTENISFLTSGRFEIKPVTDERAQRLLRCSREKYIHFQVEKIVENAMNQRFAAQLIRQKQQSPANLDS
ncbi:MAG: hypothetical protein WC374_05065 [Phycisphaerae bacterium]